jgi:hypothetical protein
LQGTQSLCQGIATRIRMTGALPLDDLNLVGDFERR